MLSKIFLKTKKSTRARFCWFLYKRYTLDASDLFFAMYVVSNITHPAQLRITGLMGYSSGRSILLWTANKPPITMSPGELASTKSSAFWQEKAMSVLITKQGIQKLTNAMFLCHLLTTSLKSIQQTAGPNRAPMSSVNSSNGKRLRWKVSHTSRGACICFAGWGYFTEGTKAMLSRKMWGWRGLRGKREGERYLSLKGNAGHKIRSKFIIPYLKHTANVLV